MVTAIILFTVDKRRVNPIAETLAAIEGVTEVYSVAGEYDLVAVIRVKSNEAVADLVTEHLLKIEGIQASKTLISFRRFSSSFEV